MSAPKEKSIKETVSVLISTLNDKDNNVNNVVIKSLVKISNVYPNEVIEVFCEFYKNTPKLNSSHLGYIIKVLEQTCVNQVKKLHSEFAKELVSVMLKTMTQNIEYDQIVQMGSSSVLVAVGHTHWDLVLRALINELDPALVPHYTIPYTLGTLAAVNTHDIVPHIKEILNKMLPLLTLVKSEVTKQAFAYAFGHFAVAVAEQIGDNMENENITSIKENFVIEFTVLFDVMYNQWLHSHDARVTESVLEALGPITRLISEKKFDETINKFVQTLLSLYRKPAVNSYYISQCISYLLSPSALNPKLCLNDNVVNTTINTLFSLVVFEPDYDQPHTVKNHFEVLRCFDHLTGQFPSPTIENLLNLCRNNQEKERMKAVIVLTHLTTSSQVFIDKFSTHFITILKLMINTEQGLKMKKLLVKAIVGLVYRNCITNPADFLMVEFIVRHCGYEAPQNAPKNEVQDLHDTCRSSLILMCNTVTEVRIQLRNLLLSTLTLDEFTNSITTITQCLPNLLQNSESFSEEMNEKLNEPKVSSELIFVCCMMFLADPEQKERNKNILLFLDEYSGFVHKNLKNSWTVEIQRLLKYVEKNEMRDQWYNMLLDLLVAAIEQVNSSKWVEMIAVALSKQIISNKHPVIIKGISLQYLAIMTCHMSNASLVEEILKTVILCIKSTSVENCDIVSKAIGIASRQHGEYVMNELDHILKEVESRRGNKLLNLISSKHSKTEAEIGVVKYVLVSSYGKVARECLDVHVLAHLGENTTTVLHNILKSNPHIDLCRATVTTLYEIARALHPASHHNVVLRNRWQLLNAVLEQIHNTNLDKHNVELYPIIVNASKALTKLQKGILPEERNTILSLLFNSIFGELSSFKKKYELEGNGEKNDLLAKTLNDSLILLHELIRELIIQSTCLSTIDDLVSLLGGWLRHENDEIRIASMLIMQVVFDAYIKNVKLNYETPSKFGQMGYLLGLTIPGVADTNFQVRLTAVDCVKLIIQIQDLYEGHTIEPGDECMTSLSSFHNNILTNDLVMISEYSMALCDIISEKIPHHHTMQFVESLLENYEDHEYRSTGISSILDALFVKKGSDLYQSIERIVEVVLNTMDGVSDEARRKLLKPLTSLTRHHSNAVTAVLLGQRIPLKTCVVMCWRYLARDSNLCTAIVQNFLRLMTSIELFEDPYHITENHVAALQPLTLVTALGEMLQEETMRPICIAKFSELFSVLYTTLACYVDAEPPAYSVPANRSQERFGFIPNREAIRLSPAKITMNTFYAFLVQADCHKVKEACALCMSVEHGDGMTTLLELVPVLGGALCRDAARHLPRLVATLAPYARSQLPPQRCAALSFLADLLNYRCNDNSVLIESVLATLGGGWKDANPRVRAASLRAAANVARLREQRDHYVPKALAALSQGVDAQADNSPVDNVPLAAIQGLSRLLIEIEKLDSEYDRELIAISQKIRPFMNTECAQLREHSIRLFGIIAGKVKTEALVDQAVSSLPCFIIHLCDSNPAVVRASKYTLRQVFKIFNIPKSNDFVQTHLLDEGKLFLEEFLTTLLRTLAEEMPSSIACCIQSTVNYLHLAREDLKPYPPLLIGTLYAQLVRIKETTKDESQTQLDPEVTSNARHKLLLLIKDGQPLVRQHSAMALANICIFEADNH